MAKGKQRHCWSCINYPATNTKCRIINILVTANRKACKAHKYDPAFRSEQLRNK